MEKNILDEIYDIAHEKVIPLSMMMELLTVCNERCIHCYIPQHISYGMNTDEVKDTISQFRKLGGLNLSLTGGEIFLRKDIFEIIEFARGLSLRVFLLTNATLLTEEIVSKLARLHISELSISVYSMKSDIHDSITGVAGSLQKTLNGIKMAKENGIAITVKTPLMEINKYEYRGVRQFCLDNDFAFLTSTIIFSKSDGDSSPKKLSINKQDLQAILKEIGEYETNKRRKEYPEACGSLKYSIAIDASGSVYPCNSLYYKVGDIKKDRLKDIWESERLKKIQNIMRSDLPTCVSCKLKEKCSRCPGLAYLEENDLYGCSSLAKTVAMFQI